MKRFAFVLFLLATPLPASAADDLAVVDRWFAATARIARHVGAEGVAVRYAVVPGDPERGALVIVTGRAESLEKYAETAYDLRDLGGMTYIYEHRGQGDSGRDLPDREKGHVADWRRYTDDLTRFIDEVVRPAAPARLVTLAHSMGGGVALAAMIENRLKPDHLFVTSPLIRFNAAPFPDVAARWLAWGLWKGYQHERYAPATGPWEAIPFDSGKNRLTGDRRRYDHALALMERNPNLRIGGPTVGWVHQMFLMGDWIEAGQGAVATPVTVFVSEGDRVILPEAAIRFCGGLPSCESIVFKRPGDGDAPRHELLFERDAIRNQVLARVRGAFIPLTRSSR